MPPQTLDADAACLAGPVTAVLGTEVTAPDWDELAAVLPEDDRALVAGIDRRIENHRERILSAGGYSEPRPHVLTWRLDGDVLHFEYAPSDYAAGRVRAELWRALSPESRTRALVASGGRPLGLFCQGLGHGALVTTADGKLVLTRRAAKMTLAGDWYFSAGEGQQLEDCEGDLHLSAYRGVREELGVGALGAPIRTTFLHFLPRDHEVHLVSHVDLAPLGVTAADVREAHAAAVDGWESDAVLPIPFTQRALLEASRQLRPLYPSTRLALLRLAETAPH